MKNRPSGTFIFVTILAVFVGTLIIESYEYPSFVRVVPMLVGTVCLLLLISVLIGEYHPVVSKWTEPTLEDLWDSKHTQVARDPSGKDEPQWSSIIKIMLYIAGFWLLVVFFGLVVVPPLFIAVFLVIEAGVRPRNAVISAGAASVLIVTSLSLMKVNIWAGIIPEIIPGYLGGSIMPPI